ncbi:MAG: hypothetical protein C5B49_16545 [Bdellovibrio sp.]|nr:MAG: hypothetical protein C5B49_16545 [Bdellovibrio sp.]
MIHKAQQGRRSRHVQGIFLLAFVAICSNTAMAALSEMTALPEMTDLPKMAGSPDWPDWLKFANQHDQIIELNPPLQIGDPSAKIQISHVRFEGYDPMWGTGRLQVGRLDENGDFVQITLSELPYYRPYPSKDRAKDRAKDHEMTLRMKGASFVADAFGRVYPEHTGSGRHGKDRNPISRVILLEKAKLDSPVKFRHWSSEEVTSPVFADLKRGMPVYMRLENAIRINSPGGTEEFNLLYLEPPDPETHRMRALLGQYEDGGIRLHSATGVWTYLNGLTDPNSELPEKINVVVPIPEDERKELSLTIQADGHIVYDSLLITQTIPTMQLLLDQKEEHQRSEGPRRSCAETFAARTF